MKIKSAEYILTAVNPDQYPATDYPEIAVVGRSNVGKSSLINRISCRKKLVKISSKPGKTRTINFFLINGAFFLVDLPGYGFAKVSAEMKKDWARMINTYLSSRDNLVSVVLLVDIRHKPTKEDKEMYEWLTATQDKVIIACTKSDKISRGRWPTHMKVIKETLGMRKNDLIVPCSSESPEGIEKVVEAIEQILPLSPEE